MLNQDEDNPHEGEEFISIPGKEETITDKPKDLQINPQYPNQLFILPLNKRPFFPGMAAPVFIEQGTYYEVLKIVAKTPHKCLGLLLTKNENANIYKLSTDDLYDVGVVARILRIIPLEKGGAQVVFNMEKRITLVQPVKGKYLSAKVKYHDDPPVHELSKEIKAYSISIITTIKELLKLNPLFKEELQIFLSHSDFTDPGRLADFAVALTTATREELQDVLSCLEIQKRIDKALLVLKKELDLSKLQSSINQRIESTISKAQREFFLREQLKAIKKELGMEKDDKTCDIEKFDERIKIRKIPDTVMNVIKEEKEKLNTLEIHSPEYGVCRNYLDWLTIVPWGMFSEENHDLAKAHKILEKDHYGLKDIKERIIEFIGVGKLTGGVKGSIICLVGPPGVGKTSVGKSVARSLNRKFYRFSVGGMRDEAEIKGHRRTYVGAMPGKMIQALKQSQAMNPVIMIDEIDKMGASYQGDPASALLEVLDPEQNKDFNDHYLDVPCDLSNVLFIVTANILDTIPAPLKDRMEIMRLSGYIQQEKVQIAKKYLIPKNRKKTGLYANDVVFKPDSLVEIIEGYSRESGVRSLENNIKKILRKVALKKAENIEKKKKVSKEIISKDNIKDFLGKPIFTSDVYYKENPIGVATGMAWTMLGGVILYIETRKSFSDKTQMKLTGQAGDVMKESSQIAWSFLASMVDKYAPGSGFFDKSIVHIHIPEGATPKDGPSAGITMTTALLSLLLDKPIKSSLAMTGEITLTGKVLAIGGLKEKLIAAKRSNIKNLIFPKSNERDYDELPDYLKKGLKIYFVEHYDDVYEIAFKKHDEKTKKLFKKAAKAVRAGKKGSRAEKSK
ncbi:MAG: endopeptidase La [Parachlamydiales bacterium]|nr:endopeptidase La [Parachlamydiales bacterium]